MLVLDILQASVGLQYDSIGKHLLSNNWMTSEDDDDDEIHSKGHKCL